MPERLAVQHFALGLTSLGGAQAVVRHHLSADAAFGLASRAMAFFDGPPGPARGIPGGRLLGLTGRHTVATARHRVRAALAPPAAPVAVYHDLWGLPFLADLDGATRRVGVIHCPAPSVLAILRHHHGLLDGVACVGEPTLAAVRAAAPTLGPDRLAWVPLPVAPPSVIPPTRPALAGRPLVLGYSGRLTRELKRVDRLPALHRALRARGLDVRLEVLGEGPARAALARAFRGQGGVVFHGRRSGAEYWQILGGWDALVYVSDVEGLGLALLEGLSVGVLPLYPRIGGGGERYVSGVRPDLVYPPGDYGHVAGVLRGLREAPAADVEALRARGRRAVGPHLGDAYPAAFARLVERLMAAPSRTAAPTPRPRRLADHVPFGVLRRVWPRALWRPAPPSGPATPAPGGPGAPGG